VIDRFGKSIAVHKLDDSSFIINVSAFISPILLGWLFSFGNKVKILEPTSLIEKLHQMAEESLSQYEN
jgi:predicted DNA-binding transcriptional regulator YafY